MQMQMRSWRGTERMGGGAFGEKDQVGLELEIGVVDMCWRVETQGFLRRAHLSGKLSSKRARRAHPCQRPFAQWAEDCTLFSCPWAKKTSRSIWVFARKHVSNQAQLHRWPHRKGGLMIVATSIRVIKQGNQVPVSRHKLSRFVSSVFFEVKEESDLKRYDMWLFQPNLVPHNTTYTTFGSEVLAMQLWNWNSSPTMSLFGCHLELNQ